jgi:hypothetical protein
LQKRENPFSIGETATYQSNYNQNSNKILTFKNKGASQEPVAHIYNPSYSGGSNQKDHDSKPTWANSL